VDAGKKLRWKQARTSLARVAARVRAAEWWDHKFAPIFAIFYASAFHVGAPLAPLWSTMLLLLLASLPGAIYVSLINDCTDLSEDMAAGKHNRLRGVRWQAIAAALGACVAVGGAVCWHWRHSPMLVAAYIGPWLAFTLYSVPPVRLKARGVFGLIADSAGAHAFPAMLAAVLAYSAAGRNADLRWVATVGLWGLCYGLRGILWHQILDADADRKAAVRTFVYQHGEATAVALGTRVVAPLELLSLLLMLIQLHSWFPVIALVLYTASSTLRVRLHGLSPTLVARKQRPLLLGKDYYDLFLPLGLLCASALLHPFDALVLAAHLACFQGRTGYLLSQIQDAANRLRSTRKTRPSTHSH
jgi:4-hydroxybenzoate polyprenyltransferase